MIGYCLRLRRIFLICFATVTVCINLLRSPTLKHRSSVYKNSILAKSAGYNIECPSIDPNKTQVLLLVIGSVRSFSYYSIHSNYYTNVVSSLKNQNVQVHQIWYFSLDDISSWDNRMKGVPKFPPSNLTQLQQLQRLYTANVLAFYKSSISYPNDLNTNPFNRSCTGFKMDKPRGIYAQAYHLQEAYRVAMNYVDKCEVSNWSYLVKTRPDWTCLEPIQWNLEKINEPYQASLPLPGEVEENRTGIFLYDSSWGSIVSDIQFLMDRAAVQKLFPEYLNKYSCLPCSATPANWFWNAEGLLKMLLVYNEIRLVPHSLEMCGLARYRNIECDFGRGKKYAKCHNTDEYKLDLWKWKELQLV
mmetsp:Transcript_32070/g.54724  ORF Transcript_32070/g.54724 Transcript_32070/m.54724 type:complete len:359 (-) Transcript_32070:675-1751(-)